MRKREREPMMDFSSSEFISFDRSSSLFFSEILILWTKIFLTQREYLSFESYSEV